MAKYFLWLSKAQAPRYKFASTQLDLWEPHAGRVIDWTRVHVDAKYLREEGIETEPHITVKYGLSCEAADAQRVLRDFGSIPVELGELDLFTTNPAFDVLICRVESPRLHAAHALLAQDLPHRETFPNYQPHLTLAYVAKGACADLVGQRPFPTSEFWFSTVTFSGRDGTKTPLALRTLDFRDDDRDVLESGLGMVFPPRMPGLLRVLDRRAD